MRVLAVLSQDDIRRLELAVNKVLCAQQALRPDAAPPSASKMAADNFFCEAIFAAADARYLQDVFWRELARQHGIAAQDLAKLSVDFQTRELILKE